MDCLLDWNIDRKLSTLTVDNCTTNDAMINILLDKLSSSSLLLNGEFFHMRCCAHILNLIVKDGLDIIHLSVEKIRDSVAYWTATPKRVEKFESSARQLKISCSKKLALDCKTRWNSTYLMLHGALQYRYVFPRLKQRESQYRCLPSDEDWKLAKEICDRLEVFFEVTEIFSGTKYPTSNLYFSNICEIKLSIYDWMKSPYEEIKMMASSMIEKFEKYWSEIHGILAVASVLDPRFKMKLVEYYFPMIFGNEVSHLEVEKIRKLCHKLLNEYKIRHGSSGNVNQFSNQIETSTSISKKDRLAQFDLFVSNTTNTDSTKSELDIFLDEPLLPRSNDFDILAWWNANSTKYPSLQKVARDVLAIPVSTVASESAFSTSGRFVSPHRNRLHPNTLEALMCARDWLWADIHGTRNTNSFDFHNCVFYCFFTANLFYLLLENSPPSSYFGCCSTQLSDTLDIEDEVN